MRKLIGLFLIALLAGCGSDGGGITAPPDPVDETGECSNDGQKQFVLDNLYAWYLWNDLLPADLSIADYASPEELIIQVTEDFGPQKIVDGQEVRSTVSASCVPRQSEQDFLEGTLGELFGFSYRFVDEADTDFRIVRVFSGSPAARRRSRPWPAHPDVKRSQRHGNCWQRGHQHVFRQQLNRRVRNRADRRQ